jgi:hypothetical protein
MASLRPFDQYLRAAAGLDFVDGAVLAGIFSRACNSLDIPARIVEMGNVISAGADYDLLGVEDRAAVEIFDRKGNRWVWFDLSSATLGIELSGYGPLNTAEVARAVNDPVQIPGLTAHTYVVATRTHAQAPLLAAPVAAELQRYFRAAPRLRSAQRPR